MGAINDPVEERATRSAGSDANRAEGSFNMSNEPERVGEPEKKTSGEVGG